MRGVAEFAGITAVLDQREIRVRPADDVIPRVVDGQGELGSPNRLHPSSLRALVPSDLMS